MKTRKRSTRDGQDPVIGSQIVSLLREHGPMTRTEISVALDLTKSVVETALRITPKVVRVGGIGAGCRGYVYGVIE